MRRKNHLKNDEKERILKLPVILINPDNIQYEDTDILLGYIIINNQIIELHEVVDSVYRGLNNVAWKAMLYQTKDFKINTLGFKINKIIGKCIIK